MSSIFSVASASTVTTTTTTTILTTSTDNSDNSKDGAASAPGNLTESVAVSPHQGLTTSLSLPSSRLCSNQTQAERKREQMRMEFYATYDVMTGVRIAATLGGFFGLMVFLVIYKSRSRSTTKALKVRLNKATLIQSSITQTIFLETNDSIQNIYCSWSIFKIRVAFEP